MAGYCSAHVEKEKGCKACEAPFRKVKSDLPLYLCQNCKFSYFYTQTDNCPLCWQPHGDVHCKHGKKA